MSEQKTNKRNHWSKYLILASLAGTVLQGCGNSSSSAADIGNSQQKLCDAYTTRQINSQAMSQSAEDYIVDAEPYFQEIDKDTTVENMKGVLRKRFMIVDTTALKQVFKNLNGKKLRLPLFEDAKIDVIIETIQKYSENNIVLSGRIAGDNLSQVTLVINNDVFVANIHRNITDEHFEVQLEADGTHAFKQTKEVDEGHCGAIESGDVIHASELTPTSEFSMMATPRVDILVAYTPRARSQQGGTDAMKALIQMGVADTNRAFRNSGVNMSVRLVGTMEVSRSESSDFTADLDSLKSTTDGRWDEVHAARKRLGADQVSLVGYYPNSSISGIGYVGASFSSAFTVTKNTAFSRYTFSHELGHNLGLHHEDGLENASGRFRTVMAYGTFTRIARFSNPSLTYNGYATGTSSHNSSKILNANATRFANIQATVVPVTETPGEEPQAPGVCTE